MIVLRTGRLTLRQFTLDDVPFVFRLLNELSFIENIGDKGVRSLDQAADYLREGPLASYERHGFGLLAVTLAGSDRPMGMCGLLKRDRLDAPDIGYAFLPEFWSHGFALEAASAVLDFARHTLGHPRTLALVSTRNDRSMRLLRKLGFSRVPDPDAGPETILFERRHETDERTRIIRPERAAEKSAIHAVHAMSFGTGLEAHLVDALRAAGRLSLSLVALVRDRIVGHVAFSPVSLAGAADGVGLGPLAVVPEHRRRGIAADLVRTGLARCRQANRGFVVVLGEPEYYSRFGFTAASGWGLHDEFGGAHAFQALELRSGSIPTGGGLVRYAPEFNEVVSGRTL